MRDKQIIVVKRDLEQELFSYDKLVTSILKAGVPSKEAEILATDVKNWVYENASAGSIDSSLIKDKIIEVMTTNFPSEADSYQAFVK